MESLSKGSTTQEQLDAYLKGLGFEVNHIVRENGSQRTMLIKSIKASETSTVILKDVAILKARPEEFTVTNFLKLFTIKDDTSKKEDRELDNF